MTPRRTPRRILISAAAAVAGTVFLLVAQPTVLAAEPGRPDTTSPFANAMKAIVQRAAEVLPLFIDTIESELFQGFLQLAFYAANVIACISFLQVLKRNNGASKPVFWWCANFCGVLILMLATNGIIDALTGIGHGVAYGDGSEDSWLNKTRKTQQVSFIRSYKKFVAGHFLVRTDGGDPFEVPPPNGNDTISAVLGVLNSDENPLDNLDGVVDFENQDGIWSMRNLYSSLSLSRGAMELADVFLILIKGIIYVALRLFAPFAVAFAISEGLAKRVSYNFLWGTVVLTVFWPIVSQLLRICAYTMGNIALAVGDSDPLYKWDPQRFAVISAPGAMPQLTIVFAAAAMFVLAVMMFFSPTLAYFASTGKIYEGVANLSSTVLGGLVGTAVAVKSAEVAAGLQRQAENTQIRGQAEAGRTEATASREAGMLRNQAQYAIGEHGARGAATAAAGAATATAWGAAETAKLYSGMNAQIAEIYGGKEVGQRNVAKDGTVAGHAIEAADTSRQAVNNMHQNEADMAGSFMGQAGGTLTGGWSGGKGSFGAKGGVTANPGAAAGTAYSGLQRQETLADNANSRGHAHAQHMQVARGTTDRANTITAESTQQIAQIQRDTGDKAAGIAHQVGSMAAGAAHAGASISIEGLAKGKTLNDQAVSAEFAGKVAAIDTVEQANLEAATLRAQATVMRTIGEQFASRIEEAAEQQRL